MNQYPDFTDPGLVASLTDPSATFTNKFNVGDKVKVVAFATLNAIIDSTQYVITAVRTDQKVKDMWGVEGMYETNELNTVGLLPGLFYENELGLVEDVPEGLEDEPEA